MKIRVISFEVAKRKMSRIAGRRAVANRVNEMGTSACDIIAVLDDIIWIFLLTMSANVYYPSECINHYPFRRTRISHISRTFEYRTSTRIVRKYHDELYIIDLPAFVQVIPDNRWKTLERNLFSRASETSGTQWICPSSRTIRIHFPSRQTIG